MSFTFFFCFSLIHFSDIYINAKYQLTTPWEPNVLLIWNKCYRKDNFLSFHYMPKNQFWPFPVPPGSVCHATSQILNDYIEQCPYKKAIATLPYTGLLQKSKANPPKEDTRLAKISPSIFHWEIPKVSRTEILTLILHNFLELLKSMPVLEQQSVHFLWSAYSLILNFSNPPRFVFSGWWCRLYSEQPFNILSTVKGFSQNGEFLFTAIFLEWIMHKTSALNKKI